MTTQHFFVAEWYWDPFGICLCGLGIVGLACLLGASVRARAATVRLSPQPVCTNCRDQNLFKGPPRVGFGFLLAALGVLVLALLSPIATLARFYLFGAHMLQHLLLLQVAPPLLLLGIARILHPPRMGKAPRCLRPGWIVVRWICGTGAMWFWHVPALCNGAAGNAWLSDVQTVSLLLLGLLFWSPVVSARFGSALPPLAGVVYLVGACFACTLLGIYLTFTPSSVCSIYSHPADPLGALPLIRDRWGFALDVDQQVGGLLMWVPGCLIYLTGVVILLTRWYSQTAEAIPGVRQLPQSSI